MQDDKGTDLFLMIKEFLGLTEVNTTVTIIATIISILILIPSIIKYFKNSKAKKES